MKHHAIDSADEADGPAILAMLVAAGLPTTDLTAQSWPHFLVGRDGAALLGAVGLEPHDHHHGLLRSLVVDPDVQGEGLGRALLHAIEKAAQHRGMTNLWLLTTTAEDFFVRHGYASVARSDVPPPIQATAEFSSLCPSSATVMRKALVAP
ncbi:arsenic resistance N-acetyltransferase ArsN2 [Synoicihabitans lomoniglobus]|uniref:Arsenic resistance N-acetyltransferase ArsN2 n=2 Tax=Synoicihabitans lomoniglobus TaxID=2909285 RepID=A0AAF0CNX5_9BACT|nr:arsenic resistance N-acetyltransferase ArsN2 [Opitutaceae bacterium LMO-M01]